MNRDDLLFAGTAAAGALLLFHFWAMYSRRPSPQDLIGTATIDGPRVGVGVPVMWAGTEGGAAEMGWALDPSSTPPAFAYRHPGPYIEPGHTKTGGYVPGHGTVKTTMIPWGSPFYEPLSGFH